ncbi:MAG TPA: hypothetical protein PKC45_07860, partial [Gemmatales bacterium]|nr:hypothetical protein [Gemmatales bacterium]
IEIKTDASEKERRDRASGGRSGGSGGGPMGGGGMGGGGPIGGGGGMGGGGPLGGGGGRDRGRPGTGGAGSSGDQEGADASGNRWIGRFVPVKDAADDQWANHIWPVRAAYVVGIYPHAKQLELNSQALKEDKATVLPYYKRLEIQRRELVLKGTRLPDGSLAAEDLVVIDDGRGSISLQPVSSLPEITKDNEAHLAGWRMVDRTVISDRLRLAASDAFREPDSIVAGLLASCRLLVQRLPEPVRGEYPPIYNEIPPFKEMVEKIKKDKTVIPPPRRDPRLERGVDDAFGDEPPPPTDSGQQPAAGDTKEQEYVPEYGLVRFLDLELDAEAVGGRTFEYRVRVVLDNPNFERPHIVAVPESARIREVRGAWSPLVRVTFPSDTYIFADERQRRTTRPDIADTSDLDKVPLQVHAWLGRISTEGGAAAEERVGDWWVDRVLASRGEFIGRIPNAYLDRQRSRGNADTFEQRSGEASLIVWVPTVPSDPSNPTLFGLEMLSKVRTPNLMTRYVLVDFEGGARLNYRPPGSNTTFREDVPAEILVLDPSGRLFTRSLLADRDHPERKERFTRWDRWFKTVKEKSERNKPKDDQPRR